nr:hypothetical protein [Pseudomonas aeruginosa]
MGAPHGYYQMGIFLEQGIGVRPDKTAAMAYYRKAADLGNRYGQWAIGDELRKTFARLPEPERTRGKNIGKQMLECALSQELPEAGYSLGMEYLVAEEDTYTALLYFQKAAALGHNDSLWKLYATFNEGKYGVEKTPELAACYERLWEESHADPSKRFPDVDTLCPLPPVPASSANSGQPAPRAGIWFKAGDPGVMFRAAQGDMLPTYRGEPVHWEWVQDTYAGRQARSGEPCPWPGYWACEDLPSGERLFAHGATLPQLEGRDVTWRLVRGV